MAISHQFVLGEKRRVRKHCKPSGCGLKRESTVPQFGIWFLVFLSLCCARMFRPCIDLHEGRVKQIVGGSLDTQQLRTNFVSEKPSTWFAELYRRDQLRGG